MKEKLFGLPRNPHDPSRFVGGVPRPIGWMENPYIGGDGKEYHSSQDLKRANWDRFRSMNPGTVNKYKLY